MASERFTFTGTDGRDYTLPKQIPAGALRKSRHAVDPMDQFFTILESVADDATIAALDELSVQELIPVMKAWFQGLNPGESSSSSN